MTNDRKSASLSGPMGRRETVPNIHKDNTTAKNYFCINGKNNPTTEDYFHIKRENKNTTEDYFPFLKKNNSQPWSYLLTKFFPIFAPKTILLDMEMNNTRTPQYPFERLYVSPFTRRRGFNEQTLTYTLVPMEQKRQRTGIELLDLVVDCLIAGSDPRSVAYKLGITLEKLSASLITLTGLSTVSLRKQWRMQLAHDLLRYTNLPFTDVMQRCGYTSMPTFSNFVRQAWGSTPKTIRINAQRRDEIGKYAL